MKYENFQELGQKICMFFWFSHFFSLVLQTK